MFCFCKQMTAYEKRISDWSSDVCYYDLRAGETVRVSGWVHRKRDHGDLVFIDLRDHYGMVQIVTEIDGPVFEVIEGLRAESVVTVTGKEIGRASGRERVCQYV